MAEDNPEMLKDTDPQVQKPTDYSRENHVQIPGKHQEGSSMQPERKDR